MIHDDVLPGARVAVMGGPFLETWLSSELPKGWLGVTRIMGEGRKRKSRRVSKDVHTPIHPTLDAWVFALFGMCG